jgi:endoribonuclease Dicer
LNAYVNRHQKYQSNLSPGTLTDLRQAAVNNITFGQLSVLHSFHKYLIHTSTKLHESITKFVVSMEKSRVFGGSDDDLIEPPKILGDIFESVAGAIMVDSNYDANVVWQYYEPLMKSFLDNVSILCLYSC